MGCTIIHKNIKNFVEKIENANKQKSFVSTTNMRAKEDFTEKFEELLNSKSFDVVSTFSCKCFDTLTHSNLLVESIKKNQMKKIQLMLEILSKL